MKSQLYNLDIPDEKADLDLIDADLKELAEATYTSWRDAVKSASNMNNEQALYDTAYRITKPYSDRLVEILKEKKIPGFVPDDYLRAGFFVSAIMNQTAAKEITCNLESDIWYIGNSLPKGKTLTNNGLAGGWLGMHARGNVVNNGEAGSWFGEHAQGSVTNRGKTYDFMGMNSTGVVENYGKARDWTGKKAKGIVLNYNETGNNFGEDSEGLVINYEKAGTIMGNSSKGTVVNYGRAGFEFGRNAKGTAINCGRTGKETGDHSNGMLINYGKAGDRFGWDNKGLAVNLGKAGKKTFMWASGITLALLEPETYGNQSEKARLKANDCRKMPELAEYFDALKVILDEGKNDYRALSKLPTGKKVKTDVESILKARGYLK